jgi:hypothetical protein
MDESLSSGNDKGNILYQESEVRCPSFVGSESDDYLKTVTLIWLYMFQI